MGLQPRVKLVTVNSEILSSYNGRKSGKPLALVKLGDTATCPEDVAEALWKLHLAVKGRGGTLRITDLHRSFESSAKARAKYENWVACGKPSIRSSNYDKKTMKNAYVAEPGKSWHNAARAIDVGLAFLNFPVAADKQLDVLWELALPLGWKPIIKNPEEGKTEAWHFDFRGPWASTYDMRRSEAVMGAVLDLGKGADVYRDALDKALQAQIWRCGQNIGKIDGHPGKLTRAGLRNLGLPETTTKAEDLYGLPSKPAGVKVTP